MNQGPIASHDGSRLGGLSDAGAGSSLPQRAQKDQRGSFREGEIRRYATRPISRAYEKKNMGVTVTCEQHGRTEPDNLDNQRNDERESRI